MDTIKNLISTPESDALVSLLVKSAPSVMQPLVNYWYIDDDGNYYYEYEPDYYYDEDDVIYDPYNYDNDFEYDDIYEGLPHYDRDDLDGADVVDIIDYYRYLVNVFLVAIPWTAIAISCIGWNLYFNYKWNEVWAGGNLWLLSNTFFILF